ncbi:MAG: hypothetical protein HXS52_10635 [Theionarchaea archaeon]|nr:hypothetical protein [Theionarchaea archaeon]
MIDFYELSFLIPLILLHARENSIRGGLGRFQIAKISAWLLVNSGICSLQERVFIYKFGPYISGFENALADLIRRNIIEIIIDSEGQTRFCITEDGKRWIMSRLRDQDSSGSEVKAAEIDRILFTPLSDLIVDLVEKSPFFKPIKYVIGDKELIRIFDWTNFGDGRIHSYHYTLLRSFYRLEDYFDRERYEAETKMTENDTDYQLRIIDNSAIPNTMHLEDLIQNCKEKHTIRYIFNKENPRSVAEDKFEGKNYIGHLWYVYSAIDIIHTLAGLAPTIDEIARVCLTNYEYSIKKRHDYSKRRKMREGAIRSDMQKLVKYGILNRGKVNRMFIYSIRARRIVDSYTSQTYSLLNPEKIRNLYEEVIRPSPANAEIIKQIIAEGTEAAMEV